MRCLHGVIIGSTMHDAILNLTTALSALPADTSTALKIFNTAIKDGDVVFIKGSLGSGSWQVRDAILSGLNVHPSSDTPSHNGGDSHAA